MHKESEVLIENKKKDTDRRQFFRNLTGFAAMGAAAGLASNFVEVRPASAQGNGQNAEPPKVPLEGSRVILLGTKGGPGVDLQRNEPASAVVVDGIPYLVDCGYGTLRALTACGIGLNQISTVFFTHLHDDHTSDLAALLTQQWTGSKTKPTDVYGPYATKAMVEGAMMFFKANVEIRIVDEGRKGLPEALFHGHDLADSSSPRQVFKDERVTVTSIGNAHYPERFKAKMPHRSLAYRFDAKDRSIVLTGDSAYTKNLVELAKGADVFVCEVLDQSVYDQMMKQAKAAADAGNPENIFRHVAETHSTPADVGRMASEANVKTVVLNHLVPGSVAPGRPQVPVTSFIDAVRKQFSGEVIVGQDLMVI